ncbi:MAG: 30S ribosomal protein S12 methylthiotransferase RimO [Elusimicrobiota bacterium]|jgi:ribosomal protein S12 methylthiotransferase|nr:30S ribosomal protein S12 methylthiotransferase RimO [Elusimicrobiota bacterium]
MKASIIVLGCPKNIVESEYMLGILKEQGFQISSDLKEADIAIVHTCSFIDSARKESEKSIKNLINLKRNGVPNLKIFVSGCLPQLLKESLIIKFPQIDGYIGTGSLNKLPNIIKSQKQIDIGRAGGLRTAKNRILSSNLPYAYLKIAEGCNHNCSFCIIPKLRGKYCSRSMQSLLKEAQGLADAGIKELIIIAQDTTSYGSDLYNAFVLDKLLVKLSEIKEIKRIRLLYAYPNSITEDLLKVISERQNISKYIDIPIQHISRPILSLMRRPLNTRKIIEKISAKYPKIVLRTSFIAGFPQETKRDIKELTDFIKEGHFQYGGVFKYCDNKESLSSKLARHIVQKESQARKLLIENAQYEVFKSKFEKLKGQTMEVLVENCRQKGNDYIIKARLDFQSPEIDGNTIFKSPMPIPIGNFVQVKVQSNKGYDIKAVIPCV